jgi:cysteine-rich repeat protein
VTPPASFACDDAAQCTVGGRCEPTGFCSFADQTCPGGWRYGSAAGNGLANACVGETGGPDAAADANTAVCGNDMVEPGEDCDDGNMMDGDACNSICLDCSGDAEVVANGHCYFRLDNFTNQAAARADCESRDAHLVSYESAEENQIGDDLMNGGPLGSYWIGLDDFAMNGTFAWHDGTPLGYTNWAPMEPDDPASSRCVDQSTAGLWGDEVCSNNHPRICERERRP